ncbi:hypothetical protein BCR36DRAFT_368934 [Piromyces finnis]|uniref:Uncharacterized protein n=1 Tax=Piromyces finnis TaxID=1754191 RepID=A0A1Y1VD58_9FUNG|nr:hypothetical protein BCR36DRAFT_368934 [Piromyces finnis]|eukprot:ORX53272.1 hypothetical protein BCR36DRAFT_368934 [Piromyces finnis]
MTKDEIDKFKNAHFIKLLNWTSNSKIIDINKFLGLVYAYNKTVVNDNEKFLSYEYKDYYKVTIKVMILEPQEINKRREIYINDMIALYKNNYGNEENENDFIKFKKIIECLSLSPLLVSRNYGKIEDLIKVNYDILEDKEKLLLSDNAAIGYASFNRFLMNKYYEEGSDKKFYAKYARLTIKELVKIKIKFLKDYNKEGVFSSYKNIYKSTYLIYNVNNVNRNYLFTKDLLGIKKHLSTQEYKDYEKDIEFLLNLHNSNEIP